MSTQVLYARIQEDLKTEVDEHARLRGVTLTTAVSDLVTRGLASISEEKSIRLLESQLAELRSEKSKLEFEYQAAKVEVDTVRALTQRSNHLIGKCVQCNSPFTGYELLAKGQCSNGHAIGSLLNLEPSASVADQRDFLLFLGALGAVVGVAYLATRS